MVLAIWLVWLGVVGLHGVQQYRVDKLEKEVAVCQDFAPVPGQASGQTPQCLPPVPAQRRAGK